MKSEWTVDIEEPEFLDANIIAIGLREKRSTTRVKPTRRVGKGSRGGSSSRYPPMKKYFFPSMSEADAIAFRDRESLLESK